MRSNSGRGKPQNFVASPSPKFFFFSLPLEEKFRPSLKGRVERIVLALARMSLDSGALHVNYPFSPPKFHLPIAAAHVRAPKEFP